MKDFKLGLALSGGGFRASLFHIGVLARLAELNVLRSVEVLSTVSGGSIVGALYYLHLKRLLESKTDSQITAADYVGIVHSIQTSFLDGVRTNVRVRAYANYLKNWRMIFKRSYSRSDRMAELYNGTFYDPVARHIPSIGHDNVLMKELLVHPMGGPTNFSPLKHNARRNAKVPMLIINATTLNTGRNWQFTAVSMGEREPKKGTTDFDKNLFLDAFTYKDFEGEEFRNTPREKYDRVPLSVAVAASACVPGIFRPLPLTDLYPNVVPKLVDGGVQDNQGVTSILYENCTHVIVSDASGQLDDQAKPKSALLFAVWRTKGILEDRVRDLELESVVAYDHDESTRALLHLREDLDVQRLKPGDSVKENDKIDDGVTNYGILRKAQRRLSNIRTDLDAFTDVEAFSLMQSGYNMASSIPRGFIKAKSKTKKSADILFPGWTFERIKAYADGTRRSAKYLRHLDIAAEQFFKIYSFESRFVRTVLKFGTILFWLAVLAGLVAESVFVESALATFLMDTVALEQIFAHIISAAISAWLLVIVGSVIVSLFSFVHLKTVNKWFLWRGRLEAL
ncbi:MAG: patatin-like phospholipase family protein [Ignavibacteriales bacterium]|nr:patatin-like phospholipase family protein [Ignavibacteriales bacterium]